MFVMTVTNAIANGTFHMAAQPDALLLEPIPCPGFDACPFPKPTLSATKHENGTDVSCEQVYGCVRCQSAQQQQETQVLGSHNLLQNPCGQERIRG